MAENGINPEDDKLMREIAQMDNFNKMMDDVLINQKNRLAEELLSGVGEQMKQDITTLNEPKKKVGFLQRLKNMFV